MVLELKGYRSARMGVEHHFSVQLFCQKGDQLRSETPALVAHGPVMADPVINDLQLQTVFVLHQTDRYFALPMIWKSVFQRIGQHADLDSALLCVMNGCFNLRRRHKIG